MSEQAILIGIDGGGTATRAVAMRADGVLVGRGYSHGSNPRNVGLVAAVQAIREAARGALAGIPLRGTNAMCLGIAGLRSAEERGALQKELLKQAPQLQDVAIRVTHDLEIAHEAAFDGEAGVCIVAGTGSACYGKDAHGRECRASGRTAERDDPGSGYAIGRAGIDKGLLSPVSLADRAAVAALAPELVAAAQTGNIDARLILESAARQLASLAQPVIEAARHGEEPVRLALFGGILASVGLYRSLALAALQEIAAPLAPLEETPPPTTGALRLAWKSTGSSKAFPVAFSV